jgi:hypothetical protein
LQPQYLAAGGDIAALDSRHNWQVLTPVYPPTTLVLIVPFALLPYPLAQAAWYFAGAALFCLGLGLLGQIVPPKHRWLYLLLGCVTLISSNTDLLLRPGNPSAITIGLLALALWFFFTQRPAWAGAVLLALALCFKPHLAAPVWAMLLLERRFRKPALLSSAAALLLLAVGVTWVQRTVGPVWLADFRSAASVPYLPGGTSSPLGAEAFRFLNLQTVTGLWWPQAGKYNVAAYAVTLVLFAFWAVALFRAQPRLEPWRWWMAFSGLLCLSLLPVYHRDYDSRLLVLTLPPMVVLLQNRWRMGLALALASVPLLFCQTTLHMEHWLGVGGNGPMPVLAPWQTAAFLRQQTIALVLLAIVWAVALLTAPVEGLRPAPPRTSA